MLRMAKRALALAAVSGLALFIACGDKTHSVSSSNPKSLSMNPDPVPPGSYPYKIEFTAPAVANAGEDVTIGLKLSPPPGGSTKGVYYYTKAYDENGVEIYPYGYFISNEYGAGMYGPVAVTTTDKSSVGSFVFRTASIYGKARQRMTVQAKLITASGVQETIVANNSVDIEINAGPTPQLGSALPVKALGKLVGSGTITKATGEIVNLLEFNNDPFKYLGMKDGEIFNLVFEQTANTGNEDVHVMGATFVSTGGGTVTQYEPGYPNRYANANLRYGPVSVPTIRNVSLKISSCTNAIKKVLAPLTFPEPTNYYSTSGGIWVTVRGLRVPIHLEVPYPNYPETCTAPTPTPTP